MASAGRGNAAQVRPALTPQQNQEILRKQRKCVSCGNTAMAKCEFRACGTCCTRLKNHCQVHGSRQPTVTQVSTPETPVRPPFQWQATPGIAMMQQYIRPPNGHTPSPNPYMNPAMMSYRMPYGSPVRMPTPPVETEAQREARLEKARKLAIIQQKETIQINALRINKMKSYAESELSFEDEAFDRYMLNSGLLDEVAGPDDLPPAAESLLEQSEEQLTDSLTARLDIKNKEAQRQKLQKAMAKSFQKLRKREGELETMLEIREFNPLGFGRRDTKRMKVQTADGKEALRRINAWEDLFQEIGSFSTTGDVSLFLDTYKKMFGHDLGNSLPHLMRREPEQLPASEAPANADFGHLGGFSQEQVFDVPQSGVELGDGGEVLTMEQLFAEGEQVMEDDPEQESLANEMLGELEQQAMALVIDSGNEQLVTPVTPGEAAETKTSDQASSDQGASGDEEQKIEEAGASEEIEAPDDAEVNEQQDEKWLENAPKLLPVRKLVTNLIKQKPGAGIACYKVDLDEKSFQLFFDNQHRYTLEAL